MSWVDSSIPCQDNEKFYYARPANGWSLTTAVSWKITSRSSGSATGGASLTGSGSGSGAGGAGVDGSSASGFLLYSIASTA